MIAYLVVVPEGNLQPVVDTHQPGVDSRQPGKDSHQLVEDSQVGEGSHLAVVGSLLPGEGKLLAEVDMHQVGEGKHLAVVGIHLPEGGIQGSSWL